MFNYKKIPHFDLIPIIIISLLLFKFVNNLGAVAGAFKTLLSILSYFIWAFAIAYLLNPLMVYVEKKFKLNRIISITIIYVVFLGALSLLIIVITPGVVNSIMDLTDNFPYYIEKCEKWIKTLNKYQHLDKLGITTYIKNNLNNMIYKMQAIVPTGLNLVLSKFINLTSILIQIFTGLIISVYFLKDKESIINNIKRFISILLPSKKYERFIGFGRKVNDIFSQYLVGKLIDSLIIGLLCFIGLAIIKVPYALLLSLLFGILNMIPYFGNAIGMIPICIITFFYSPIKSLVSFIFLMTLQQVDGLLIGPKILGGKIGLSPVWVLLGIAVGGGTFGVIGMFLGVPVMAVVKMMLEDFMESRKDIKIDL